VPIQKYFKLNKLSIFNSNFPRNHSTLPDNSSKDIPYIKVYENAFDIRKVIYKENTDKSGIYMFTNKLTNDIYIGQSKNLVNRFRKYFSPSYLKHKENLLISKALIKYGFSNFSLTILEYCKISDLVNREQYYFDTLKPKYNTLKIAGSSLNYKHTKETKLKISNALKGIYKKKKSALFGHTASDNKVLMSVKKAKENNPLFCKTLKESTTELMKQKALELIHTEETKLKMSSVRGNPIYIYEKCSSEGFKLIGSFVSARRVAKFLEISGSTIIKYRNSGETYKDRYKFSPKVIKN
jgi:group I intron endonuclease